MVEQAAHLVVAVYAERVSESDAVYIGLRGPQPAFGHGGPRVVGVREGARHRTLRKHRDARTLPVEFEWGYEDAGPGVLAEAILADRLGYNPDPVVTKAFEREVVARLEGEFELAGSEVDDWVSRRLVTVLPQ